MKRRITAVLLLAALLLCGCQQNNQVTKVQQKRVCVITKAMDSIHWRQLADGLKQAADEENFALTILYPEDESSVQEQLDILRDAIASEPDVLAVAPCDARAAQDYMAQAKEKGIHTFYMDEQVADPQKIPYIGSNNTYIGRQAALLFAQKLSDGAAVAVISGSSGQTTHNKRRRGFRVNIRNHTQLQLVEDAYCVQDSSMSGGQEMMRELLAQHPEVQGVFCTNAMMLIGAAQECRAEGRRDVRLIGVDTQTDALSLLQEGEVVAMISQNGYEIGRRTIEVIADALAGKDIAEVNYVENRVIDPDNVEDMIAQYYREGRNS